VKVNVDRSLCQGHARCCAIEPEVFTLDDDGYSDIGTDKPVPAGLEAKAREAVATCPERALSVDS
jgi:ferredoxin